MYTMLQDKTSSLMAAKFDCKSVISAGGSNAFEVITEKL